MKRSELLELTANGENSGIEFKRDDIRPEQLAREIVALANFHGGRVLLGVEDDGAISGIQRPNLEEWVMDTVFGRYIHPMILPFYEEIQMEPGKRIAVVSITQGTAKPYVVRHHGREDIHVRMGSTTRLATREQQARLFALGGLLHTELFPVSGSTLADLDRTRLIDYLGGIIGDRELPTDDRSWTARLEGLGFMDTPEGSQAVCTVSGLVLFGYRPRRLLRQAGVRWMAFSDADMDYEALDDTVLDGPLVGLWQSRKGARERIQDGLLECLLARMRPFVSQDSGQVTEALRRERIWHYPLEALREGLLNAFTHRDWTRNEEIEVVRYGDRLEIKSPGSLQNSMTVEKMVAGQRSPRNPLIVEVLRDYGYVDARGMGVRTKIIPLLTRENGVPPEFAATEDYLSVKMYRGPAIHG